ncbi:prepilin peptidase [Candidatus Parcubacteria bacterium]|nr:MAG: prepilin peptidase [Candidatus Parcubacteria bacterium]
MNAAEWMPIVAVAGAIGLASGSFLTVALDRVDSGGTILRGRSRCPSCKKSLRWYELVPLASFMWQRGRCRSCGTAIPLWYPAIEATLGLALVGVLVAGALGTLLPPPFRDPLPLSPALELPAFIPGIADLLYYGFVAVCGAAIAFYDLRRLLILPQPTWALAALGAFAHAMRAYQAGSVIAIVPAVAAAAAIFGLFWLLWFLSRGRGMGRGDADVAFALALAIGFPGSIVAIILAFWFGAAYGILALAFRRIRWKSEVPFAPFLVLGAYAAITIATTAALWTGTYGW